MAISDWPEAPPPDGEWELAWFSVDGGDEAGSTAIQPHDYANFVKAVAAAQQRRGFVADNPEAVMTTGITVDQELAAFLRTVIQIEFDARYE